MKNTLKKLLIYLKTLPFIGKPVRFAIAVYRLPRSRAQLISVLEMLPRLESAYRDQLPPLLETVSKLNHRQNEIDRDQENLIRSIPVALRTLRQEVSSLQGTARESSSGLNELRQALSEQSGALRDQENFIQSVPVALRELRQEITTLQGAARENISGLNELRQALSEQLDALNGIAAAEPEKIGTLVANVEYLLGRVEFVRRELMFEMRYGGRAVTPGGDTLEVQLKVVSAKKLSAARRSKLRLNIGCGHVPLDGYLNVDRRELPGVDIVAEAGTLPFKPGEVDEIFSAHLLEHFPQEQLRRELLPYWKSLLKPGGLFRAVVPDAEAMMREYSGGRYPYDHMRQVFYGAQDYDGDFHHNMFTPESLSALLREAGFIAIEVPVKGRRNDICFEFEITVQSPA